MASPTTNILVKNTNSAFSLEFYDITISNGDFEATNGCYNIHLNPNETCVIGVIFTPTSPGPKTGQLLLYSASPASPHALVLSGSGQGSNCQDIFEYPAISIGATQDRVQMIAVFDPSLITTGLSVSEAASMCSYSHFNWHQIVLHDPFHFLLDPPQLSDSYLDPPLFPNMGASFFGGDYLDGEPFYWNEERPRQTFTSVHIDDHTSISSVNYLDAPSRPSTMPLPNMVVKFKTRLAGVRDNGSWDSLYAFTWSVDFSGVTRSKSDQSTGNVLEYRAVEIDEIDPPEWPFLGHCSNCPTFSDGFESGDTSAWSAAN